MWARFLAGHLPVITHAIIETAKNCALSVEAFITPLQRGMFSQRQSHDFNSEFGLTTEEKS
jgi:hypothetical protein